MADTAFLVNEIDKELQQLHKKGSDDGGVLEVVDSLENRSNRLHPVLSEALTIVPKATPSSEEVEAFRGALRSITKIMSKLHTITFNIVHKDRQSAASELLSSSPLLGHLQQALIRVQALDPNLLERRQPSTLEKFVVFEYIPTAEGIFSLEKELKKIARDDTHPLRNPSSKMAFLQHRWQKAHRALNQCARNHYKRIVQALYSIARARDMDDERKMTALARFAEKGVSKELQASRKSVRKDLLDAARELEEITHKRIAFRFKKIDATLHHPVTLPAALALAYQMHEMLPRMKDAHERLHALESKLRLLASRAARHDEASMRLMQKNDAMRLKINKLKRELLSMRKELREQSAVVMGIAPASGAKTSDLDCMKPLRQLAALEREAAKQGSKPRFTRELDELRSILKEIHLNASQLWQAGHGVHNRVT